MGELSMPIISDNLLNAGEQLDEKENIVITGFGLFSGHKVNSSWEAVKEVQKEGLGDKYNIIAEKLEVEYKYVDDHVPELWEKHKPKLMIHCGLSAIAKDVTLEHQAHRSGYETKDVAGCFADDLCCCASGDDVIETSFSLGQICNAVNHSDCGVAAVISNDPGRFLCDYTYYKSLSIDPTRSLFIHVPPLNNPYTAKELALAIKVIILEMLEQLDEQNFNDDLQSLHINECS